MIQVYEHMNIVPRELKMTEDCVDLLRQGRISFCSECGAVVVQPMIHQGWHEKQVTNESITRQNPGT